MLDTAGINTSALAVKTPTTTTAPIRLPMPTPTLSGKKDTEHNTILNKIAEIKTAVNDGFAQLATKINEIGLKQRGGRRTRKNSRRRRHAKV